MRKDIKPGVVIRSLEGKDVRYANTNGLQLTIEALSPTEDTFPKKAEELYREIYIQHQKPFVVELHRSVIVAYAKMLLLTDFAYGGRPQARIESVSVHPEHRKAGYGGMLVSFLVELAGSVKCRKVVLSCEPGLCKFYAGAAGFTHRGVIEMRKDL